MQSSSIAADKTRKTVKKKNSIWTVVLRHRKSNETLYPPNDINNPWIPPFHRDLTPKYPPITYGAYGTIMLPMDLSPFTVLLSLNITPVESTEEMQADSVFRIWLTTQRVTPDIVDQSWMQEDDGDFDSGACLFEGGKVPEILVPDGYTYFQRRTLLALYDLSVQKWTAPPIRPTKDKSLSRILAINIILNKTISELNRYL
ncbi:hypothetical protein BDR26DRAFT_5463 [Obelidium mucronatum]|nr:hypothetical protein BDR26DRAFT_5463 [Obelidium mucronatum]